jgi:putative DNA primase/helicase
LTLPDIEDNTHGMWRRLHLIEFPRKFAEYEMDVELTEKLMGELSGIFNWALEGYKRLGGQKFIFSESPKMSRSKKRYQQQSNSALEFIDHCLKDSTPEDSIAFKDLYDCYSGFCATEGNKRCLPKKEFRAALENEGITIVNSSKHSNQLRVFGVKYEVVCE